MRGRRTRSRDERGITLQTLIVTAVLVLMAGAAGVVIIAITTNSKDNLEAQDTGIDARCEPWEIFDPTLQAKGIGGTDAHGGLESSAIGCRRVCYVVFNTGASSTYSNWASVNWKEGNAVPANMVLDKNGVTRTANTGTSGTNPLIPLTNNKTSTPANEARLLFSTSDIATKISVGSNKDVTMEVNGDRTLRASHKAENTIAIKRIKADSRDITDDDQLANYVIKVAPNQNYCHLWNTTTNQEAFRSQN